MAGDEVRDEAEPYTLRDRLSDFIGSVRFGINEHWVWATSALFVLAAGAVGLWKFLPDSNVDSARWTLSALVQGTAAIFGTTFVGLVFLWTEAERSMERLRSLRREYAALLSTMAVQVTEQRDGADQSYPVLISELERYRRRLVEVMRKEDLGDLKEWLKYTAYESPKECLQDVSALRRAVALITNPRSDEVAEETASGLIAAGLTEDDVGDVGLSEYEAITEPTMFFELVTRVVEILNMLPNAIDERTLQFRDEVWQRSEQDEIPTLLNRVRRMRRLRGWVVRLAIVALTAAIAWGLVVLVGYSESTPRAALAAPVAAGMLGTLLVAALVGRLLTTE